MRGGLRYPVKPRARRDLILLLFSYFGERIFSLAAEIHECLDGSRNIPALRAPAADAGGHSGVQSEDAARAIRPG